MANKYSKFSLDHFFTRKTHMDILSTLWYLDKASWEEWDLLVKYYGVPVFNRLAFTYVQFSIS